MRVIVYDKNPGSRTSDKFLAVAWLVGCWIQKLFGQVDDYFGATSWNQAIQWLTAREEKVTSIQYWGHGSPGCVWLAGENITAAGLLPLRTVLTVDSLLWFRTCSTFQGQLGQSFARALVAGLGCTVAAHTRTIGLLQGGLHTLKPGQAPGWPETEGNFPPSLLASLGLKWGNNTILCLATKIPKGW